LEYRKLSGSQVGWAHKDCFLRQSGGLGLGTKLFQEVCTVAEGTVKWFSEQKGYGFIEQDDGGDIFVHHSAINMPGFRTLREGDRVSFEVGEGTKGPAAQNVMKL
jgi:CspA family cold shock protein